MTKIVIVGADYKTMFSKLLRPLFGFRFCNDSLSFRPLPFETTVPPFFYGDKVHLLAFEGPTASLHHFVSGYQSEFPGYACGSASFGNFRIRKSSGKLTVSTRRTKVRFVCWTFICLFTNFHIFRNARCRLPIEVGGNCCEHHHCSACCNSKHSILHRG